MVLKVLGCVVGWYRSLVLIWWSFFAVLTLVAVRSRAKGEYP